MRPAGSTDFRDFRRKGDKRALVSRENPERAWWALEGEQCAQSIKGVLELLKQNQQHRARQLVISARLYGNLAIMGNASSSYAQFQARANAVRDRVTQNETQITIDTLVARIGEVKPRPYFLTSGGNYRQQRRAKKLNQFVEGVFYETKTYDIGLEAFRDGCIWGDGFIHVYGRAGKLCHERVLPSELWTDEVEGQYGFPRNMHRVKLVDKDQLAGDFPECRKEIFDTPKDPEASQRGQNLSDMVRVVESWHLGTPDEKGEVTGGLHCISLPDSGVMLVEPEEWPYEFFPFARFSWCRRPLGYWSQGFCEQAQGTQMELNKSLWLIQRSMHLAGTPKVLLPVGSSVVKEEINNDVGTIITFAGSTPPQWIVAQPIHEVYFQNVSLCAERIRRLAGLNEMSTSAAKPQGLNSGKALREFEDIQSDRHRSTQRANDNLYLQIAMLDVAMAREMARTGKLKEVRVPGKNAFAEINFKKDIGNIQDSEFVMQCFPVSRLPRDPSGRLQTIQEYMQAGFMTMRQGRRALDFPDIEAIESLANAQEDVLCKVLDDIIDEGIYAAPEPTDDLELAKEMVIEYIQRYRLLDLEDEKMAMLRNWSSQIDALQDMAAAAMTPPPVPGATTGTMPPGAGMGAPQAVPQAPPVSDLLPNAPGAAA